MRLPLSSQLILAMEIRFTYALMFATGLSLVAGQIICMGAGRWSSGQASVRYAALLNQLSLSTPLCRV
jgi:hypothetical protein